MPTKYSSLNLYILVSVEIKKFSEFSLQLEIVLKGFEVFTS